MARTENLFSMLYKEDIQFSMTNEGKVKCKICGNQFRKAGLHLHMHWAHGVTFEEKTNGNT